MKKMRQMLSLSTVAVLLVAGWSVAQEGKPQEAPPLPFHAVEGYGGVFATYSAYLVNCEGAVGLPSAGAIFVLMNHGRNLSSFTLTETLLGRVELGYGYNRFAMGDLPDAIQRATGVRISDDDVVMHNINAMTSVRGISIEHVSQRKSNLEA